MFIDAFVKNKPNALRTPARHENLTQRGSQSEHAANVTNGRWRRARGNFRDSEKAKMLERLESS